MFGHPAEDLLWAPDPRDDLAFTMYAMDEEHQAAYNKIEEAIFKGEILKPIWSADQLENECWWNYREAELLNKEDWRKLYDLYQQINS